MIDERLLLRCVTCAGTVPPGRDLHDCPCCGDAGFCYSCVNEHLCGAKGCRRCGSAATDDPEGPWCGPCRAEVAGGVDVRIDEFSDLRRRLGGAVDGSSAKRLGGGPWLAGAADALESIAAELRAAAAALALADAPRAAALALMGEGMPAKWNLIKEVVELRGLDSAAARRLVEKDGKVLSGPAFTPDEWIRMRKKDAGVSRG